MAAELADQQTQGLYPISVVTEMTGLSAHTLRGYERAGLLQPACAAGGMRLYSPRDGTIVRRAAALAGDCRASADAAASETGDLEACPVRPWARRGEAGHDDGDYGGRPATEAAPRAPFGQGWASVMIVYSRSTRPRECLLSAGADCV